MIINHKYKFIFLKTRKVAGSSMEIALSNFTTDSDVVTLLAHKSEENMRNDLGRRNKYGTKIRNHATTEELLEFLDSSFLNGRDIFNTYFKFTIIRDPIDTFISQYFFFLRNKKIRPNINEWIKDLKERDRDNVIKDNWLIYTLNDKPIIDDYIYYSKYSGKGSRMYEDCERISMKLGLPQNLADIFSNIKTKHFYRDRERIFLNEESLEFIQKVSERQLRFTNMSLNTKIFTEDVVLI